MFFQSKIHTNSPQYQTHRHTPHHVLNRTQVLAWKQGDRGGCQSAQHNRCASHHQHLGRFDGIRYLFSLRRRRSLDRAHPANTHGRCRRAGSMERCGAARWAGGRRYCRAQDHQSVIKSDFRFVGLGSAMFIESVYLYPCMCDYVHRECVRLHLHVRCVLKECVLQHRMCDCVHRECVLFYS